MTSSTKEFKVGPPKKGHGEAVILYAEGGRGKTELAMLAPDPVFINIDRDNTKPGMLEVGGVETWADIRLAVQAESLWTNCKTVVIDTATVAQKLAEEHVVATIPHEKGNAIKSIDDYGWGKGSQYILDQFNLLMGDLDAHKRAGRNVIIICHALTDVYPNPEGEDYIRFEPSLHQPKKSGRVRDAVKNWCDHMIFINADVAVKDGRARGGNSLTIYGQPMATFWAKSRTMEEPLVYERGSGELWDILWKDKANG